MGLFDGKIIELGNTLADNLDKKAQEGSDYLQDCIAKGMPANPGQSMADKITIQVLKVMAQVIRESIVK